MGETYGALLEALAQARDAKYPAKLEGLAARVASLERILQAVLERLRDEREP